MVNSVFKHKRIRILRNLKDKIRRISCDNCLNNKLEGVNLSDFDYPSIQFHQKFDFIELNIKFIFLSSVIQSAIVVVFAVK